MSGCIAVTQSSRSAFSAAVDRPLWAEPRHARSSTASSRAVRPRNAATQARAFLPFATLPGLHLSSHTLTALLPVRSRAHPCTDCARRSWSANAFMRL